MRHRIPRDPNFPDKPQEGDGQTESPGKWPRTRDGELSNLRRSRWLDPGDVLTYSLSGTNAASFDINRATGQLITKALDFEDTNNPSDNEFEVTVTATDPFGVTATSDVTITVTDVNEDPSVMGAASIDHAENGTELDTD